MTNHASDFAGFYWYQWFVPLVTWGSLAGCFLGPLLDPSAWIVFVRLFMVMYLALGATHTWRLCCAMGETMKVIVASKKRAEAGKEAGHHHDVPVGLVEAGVDDMESLMPMFGTRTFYHVFIIPNYQEPMELLQRTLEQLSKHKGARTRYMVVLAMEEAEEGHRQKASLLKDQFGGLFLNMFDTSHVKSEDDMGVAANSNWAIRHVVGKLTGMGFSLEEIVITKIDSDAEVPPLYVDVLDQALQAEENPHMVVFAPPVLFERNSDDVPDPTRVMDFVWSALSWQLLCNRDDVGFPISNYSLSLKLLQDIDYLDTNAFAIAEDVHLYLKAFFKTRGQAKLRSVMVPLNMVCVKTQDGGWIEDVKARAIQAERHFQVKTCLVQYPLSTHGNHRCISRLFCQE